MYPVYSESISEYGDEVEVDPVLWAKYCEARLKFFELLCDLDEVIGGGMFTGYTLTKSQKWVLAGIVIGTYAILILAFISL